MQRSEKELRLSVGATGILVSQTVDRAK